MSRFVKSSAGVRPTDRIELGDGEYVLVKQRLSAPETAALQRRLFSLKIDPTDRTPRLDDFAWQDQYIAVVKSYAVEWNLTDDDGQPMPCSAESIDLLDEDTVREIANGIDSFRAKRQEEREAAAPLSVGR